MAPLLATSASLIAAVTGLAGVSTCAYAMFAPRSNLFGRVTHRGCDPLRPTVALTFDDGPLPGSTDAILDTLARESLTAAFFVIGRLAAQHPELVLRMHEEGHLVCNHSLDHSRVGMFRWTRYWINQIGATDRIIEDLTGVRPGIFRPPMGFKSPHLICAARRLDHTVVTWSRRGFDGVRTTPDDIVRRMSPARATDILQLHDGRDPASRRPIDATVAALPRVIAAIRGRALMVERLDTLIGAPGAPRSAYVAP